MKTISIVGGGFAGTMLAVQLIEQATQPLKIQIINKNMRNMARGVAYHPYSKTQLLNVPTAKMSAFPDRPTHFLDWVMQQPKYQNAPQSLVANAFLPRYFYGNYLVEVWEKAQQLAAQKGLSIELIEALVTDINIAEAHQVQIELNKERWLNTDYCVLATGNNIPRNPNIANQAFYQSPHYFQNPWKKESVEGLAANSNVLIVGNGLTMVDTVLGLLENDFHGTIYSLSPNGFNILPHRHGGVQYTQLAEELDVKSGLTDLVKLVNKHIKQVRGFGISAEPIIDSFRPFTHQIWQNLNDTEKQCFMNRLRHLWGVARHRIPLHIHDHLQQLRINGQLKIISGKLLDIQEKEGAISVKYYDKKDKKEASMQVVRVINCTGPETDLSKTTDNFLSNALNKGYLTQDALKLGLCTDVKTFQIRQKNGTTSPHFLTLGSNLKGELWESTAANELRAQAKQLANFLVSGIEQTDKTASN